MIVVRVIRTKARRMARLTAERRDTVKQEHRSAVPQERCKPRGVFARIAADQALQEAAVWVSEGSRRLRSI